VRNTSAVSGGVATISGGNVAGSGLQQAALAGGHPIDPDEVVSPRVQDSPSAPPMIANGKRVLTAAEQEEMDQEEIQGLLRSGQVILEQDLAGS
jgi:hypothetical protein